MMLNLFYINHLNKRHFCQHCNAQMLWSHCKQWLQRGVGINACTCAFLSAYMCVCLGIATQTEATLISVLESNLACVQNGSLYQLGGSLPCLESGGSRSSDAFLMTAQREQPYNHLLQRPTVHWERTRKRLFMFCYWSNSNPISIDIIWKAAKVVMFWWFMRFWEKIGPDFPGFLLISVVLFSWTRTMPKGRAGWQMSHLVLFTV